jgi:hypothetical protein
VAALLAWATVPEDARGSPDRPVAPMERVLGPIAGLAASVQWVRFDLAVRRGDAARAYAHAESALRLAPGDPGGWIFLAHHLVYDRASILREPDREARARWVQAGLGTLERGQTRCRQPGALLFERGIALAFQASLSDEDRAWPRSRLEAWRLAAEAFEAAAELGVPHAALAAAHARARVDGESAESDEGR